MVFTRGPFGHAVAVCSRLDPLVESLSVQTRMASQRRCRKSFRCGTQVPRIADLTMTTQPSFQSASPYKDDVLALPVTDLDAASDWYCKHFVMTEIERRDAPNPSVILERDGVQIGFAINGGDPAQEGAAIRVSNIGGINAQLESNGVSVGDTRVDERDGEKFNAFFVVAPDGLCYYFNEPIAD